MLNTDNIILEILQEEKLNNNPLLKYFHITAPSNRVAEEDNNIFVACVSTENNMDGFDFSSFQDLVEILIVTKKVDYDKAITLLKTICNEVCRVIMINADRFPNKPVIRNINPEFSEDYHLHRGHIMVQVNTEPVKFEVTDEDYRICSLILHDNIIIE
ncbi:hypothetical protein [Methanobrevibacter sp.]